MKKLCTQSHKNIICVFEHGQLNGTAFYFIDMDLCDFTLYEYLRGAKSIIRELPDWAAVAEEGQQLFMITGDFSAIS